MEDLVILILAVWRISHMLVEEGGPWHVLERFRYRLGVRYDQYSVPYGEGMLGELLTCVWCTSMWVGAVVGVLYLVWPVLVGLFLIPALSGGAIIVESLLKESE